MKISPQWIRDFVDLKVDERKLAEDLTMAGLAVEGIAGEGADTVYEMEITTNRPDAMNHYGVARECSAIYDLELKPLRASLPASKDDTHFPIEIQDPLGCGRYTAMIVRNVKITPSPERIVARLERVEQRGINNAADASNYVLWEMGHPTHAFDLDLLEGGRIIVRRAREGESLKTLDGVERKLTVEDLVIADARKPVGLAGLMGGFDTMITDKTRNILIESAWFDPVSIRKSSRRLGLHTDASHRFERGADWGATETACARVAQLILESSGGKNTAVGGMVDAIGRSMERPPVKLRHNQVRRILGKEIAEEEISRILRRLGFGVTPRRTTVAVRESLVHGGRGGIHAVAAEEASEVMVQIPTWRLDVEREIDLLEEIARIHGFNQFPNTLPEFGGAIVELPDAGKDAKLRGLLLALGYNECLSLTFIAREETQAFSKAQAVQVANPLSEEAAFMRNSMLPGMLAMLGRNLNRGTNDALLFEAGNIYEAIGESTEEPKRITLGATGSARPASVHEPPRPYTFFDIKGDIETLLSAFEHQSLSFEAPAADYYHPGRSARAVMDGSTVAEFGQLHPEIAAVRKLRQDVFVAEIYLDRLYQHGLREPHYQAIPRYPAVDRDFSFVFDQGVKFEQLRRAVEALQLPELRSFAPMEIFRGGAIPQGKYSVLLRAEFQSAARTLRDEEVAVWAQQIVKALEALGGVQRA